jgi:hypothetical protein
LQSVKVQMGRLPARGAVFGASRRYVEIDDARNFFELQVQIMPRRAEIGPISGTKRNNSTASITTI